MIKWLQEKYDANVATVTLDLGQQEDLGKAALRAKQLGVVSHNTIYAVEEFAEEYIVRAIKANAMYEGKYPLATALARPLIAQKLVEVAEDLDAYAVAHGCTGKGNDQVRFDVTIRALHPDLKVYAPVREWNLSREAEIEYAKSHGVKIDAAKSIYSVDENLWGRSIESGPLEDPAVEPAEEVFAWTNSPERCPDEADYVEVRFAGGVPVALDGRVMPMVELIGKLNEIAGRHGVGRIDHIEDRLVGIKSREVYEAPAAVTLIEAHRDLEKLVLTKQELAFKELVEREWVTLVYNGLWVDPYRQDLEGFIDSTQRRVEGSVRVKLWKGSARVVGRSSPNSLYVGNLATYSGISGFDQRAAEGFIELWGLPSRVASLVISGKEGKRHESAKRQKTAPRVQRRR
jgi:argininosuccinate synthase